MKNNLELRMYFFTIFSLNGISKGIACGHAALEYVRMHGLTEEFNDFVTNWKTWIILNGGTTNERRDFEGVVQGSLNQIADDLLENDIKFGYFQEPDLNGALTAVCFICDERVFNREDYPNFVEYFITKHATNAEFAVKCRLKGLEVMKEENPKTYKEWVRFIGGVKNVFLRELIRNKKLA